MPADRIKSSAYVKQKQDFYSILKSIVCDKETKGNYVKKSAKYADQIIEVLLNCVVFPISIGRAGHRCLRAADQISHVYSINIIFCVLTYPGACSLQK